MSSAGYVPSRSLETTILLPSGAVGGTGCEGSRLMPRVGRRQAASPAKAVLAPRGAQDGCALRTDGPVRRVTGDAPGLRTKSAESPSRLLGNAIELPGEAGA